METAIVLPVVMINLGGKIVERDGKTYKEFYGMSSVEAEKVFRWSG